MYGTGAPLQGIVAICWLKCEWGNCPAGNIMTAEFVEGMGQMEVNGEPVTNITSASVSVQGNDNCDFLRNKSGHHFQPNANGQFEIRARATDPDTYFRFSSFVIC